MFNSYFVSRALTEKKYVVPIYVPVAYIARFDADVPTLVTSDKVQLIDPRLQWRSVTPSQRMSDGVPMSPSATGFLKPTLEQFQMVSSVLETIDDNFSRQAAYEKFMKAMHESTSTPASTPAPTSTSPAPTSTIPAPTE